MRACAGYAVPPPPPPPIVCSSLPEQVRVQIIRHARTHSVGKSQSCMFLNVCSSLPEQTSCIGHGCAWEMTTPRCTTVEEALAEQRRTTRLLYYMAALLVPSPFNKCRDCVCKSIEMTGFYPTILKCPELGPDIYLTEQVLARLRVHEPDCALFRGGIHCD